MEDDNNMSSHKKRLTLLQMLSEPYVDVQIEQLMNEFTLDIERFPLGSYRYYTPQQLLTHYNLEVQLANRLREASKDERRELYTALYDELFRTISYHPQLIRKSDPEERVKTVKRVVETLKGYISPDSTFLELGPGDCQLSFEMARHVRKVYAIDVSEEVTKNMDTPDNFELILSDGSSVDVLPGSIDLAYSNQLMEHLHPDDVVDQLGAIHRALAPGGIYYCATPHRFGGPTDVSRFFDREAKGFHLKEYTLSEINSLFKSTGFKKICLPKRLTNDYINFPVFPSILLERVIQILPYQMRRKLYRRLQSILTLRFIAIK